VKAVVDTNVLIPAIWRADTAPGPILDAWRMGQFELVTSEPILNEIEEVLHYPRIRRRSNWVEERIAAFMETLRADSTVVVPIAELKVVRDPDDNRFLEAAVAGEADCLVTLDEDLLSVGHYEGIAVVTPARFLAMLVDSQL
jgi:putative PIN family toxin of toxin-antitoxin system